MRKIKARLLYAQMWLILTFLDPRYDFQRNGKSLFIKSVQSRDEGSYTCEAVNDFLGRSQKLWAFSNPRGKNAPLNPLQPQGCDRTHSTG